MNRPALPLLSMLAMLLLLTGCAILDADTPPERAVVLLREGQRIALLGHNATLTFVEKTEDSRCAVNVVCIWEGQVKILMEVARSGQGSVSFELVGFVDDDENDPSSQPGLMHEALGLRFTLKNVDPYPIDGVEQTYPVTATIRVKAL